MFDTSIRTLIDPLLDQIGSTLARAGVSANFVSWVGFAIGFSAALSIVYGQFILGLTLIILSRGCDGLDGAIARATEKTDLGGYLDIVLDFAFYGMIPLAFIISNPAENAIAGGVLLLSFYINGASFLAYALMAEKRGVAETERGNKSLVYTTGLAEAGETIAVFVAMCLLPHWFNEIAYGFAAIVLLTTGARFILAYGEFGKPKQL